MSDNNSIFTLSRTIPVALTLVIFSGGGKKQTPCTTIQGLERILVILAGKVSSEFRDIVLGVFDKVVRGDPGMIEVIKINAVSNNPLQNLHRQAAAYEQVAPESNENYEIVKKRQRDKEDALFDMEMAERKQRLMQLTADAQVKVVEVQKMLMDTYTSLCPNRIIDDRARLMFKDNILNLASQSSPVSSQFTFQPAIENGAIGVIGVGSITSPTIQVSQDKPITISTLAAAMGRRFDKSDSQKIGKKVVASYREKYGQEPSKHEQLVDGAVRLVNSYTERDRVMLETVIANYVKD